MLEMWVKCYQMDKNMRFFPSKVSFALFYWQMSIILYTVKYFDYFHEFYYSSSYCTMPVQMCIQKHLIRVK